MNFIAEKMNERIENFCQDFFDINKAPASIISDDTLSYYSFLDIYFQVSMGLFAIKAVNYCFSEISKMKIKDFLWVKKLSSNSEDLIFQDLTEKVNKLTPEDIFSDESESSSDTGMEDNTEEIKIEDSVFEEIKI